MPLYADSWMLDHPGLEPSQLRLRRDLEQIQVETDNQFRMNICAVRSILPSVPDYGGGFSLNKTSIEIDSISLDVQRSGGNPGLYEYIKAVVEGKVGPTHRPVYDDCSHGGLKTLVERLRRDSSRGMPGYSLHFSRTNDGNQVHWLNNTVLLPFSELDDQALNSGTRFATGLGCVSTKDGIYFPVDSRLYLSSHAFICRAELALGTPWVRGTMPDWDLFDADDPQTPHRLASLLGYLIGQQTDNKTANDFIEFFVDWYKEQPNYQENLKWLARQLEFLEMLEFDDVHELIKDLENSNLPWHFADQRYGSFFYHDDDDNNPVKTEFWKHRREYDEKSSSNHSHFIEGNGMEIFELSPFLRNDSPDSLGYKLQLRLNNWSLKQLLEQPKCVRVDSLLLKQLANRLGTFLDKQKLKEQIEE